MSTLSASALPVIDIAPLITDTGDKQEVAAALHNACTSFGFFYVVGHGIDQSLQEYLETQSKQFFAQDIQIKMSIRMALGGIAWRGYFPVGGELTSGKPDRKEGLYFGTELNGNNPSVQARLPLHGPNLFPPDMPDFKNSVLNYIAAMTRLGHQLMEGLALSLGLEASYFARHYTGDPLCLFRIFHYPPAGQKQGTPPQWGVGEHTDYGLLTILKQDNTGGLQIKTKGRWLNAPAVPDSFICNIGDMLERMTGSYYRSTPHRVLNTTGNGRLSYPFFFDPNFNAKVRPVPLTNANALKKDDKTTRWDKASVHDFKGTYGDYILTKIAKVFPELKNATDTGHSNVTDAEY